MKMKSSYFYQKLRDGVKHVFKQGGKKNEGILGKTTTTTKNPESCLPEPSMKKKMPKG